MYVRGIAGHISVTRYFDRTSADAFFAERLEVYKVNEVATALRLKLLSYGVLKLLV
jgi:hypothetical protein